MPAKSTLSLPALIALLERDNPDLSFVAGKRFAWHGGKRNVSYMSASIEDATAQWSVLHELGHALLDHNDYESDIELLQMEAAAWEKAHLLAENYGIVLDEEYVQDCLDSYRDWLHTRATCPTCSARCLQTTRSTYRCHNCNTSWRVTRSRLCRPYRRKHAHAA